MVLPSPVMMTLVCTLPCTLTPRVPVAIASVPWAMASEPAGEVLRRRSHCRKRETIEAPSMCCAWPQPELSRCRAVGITRDDGAALYMTTYRYPTLSGCDSARSLGDSTRACEVGDKSF